MPDLVALSMPGGPRFVDAVRRIWDEGDAVLPLDPRLPARHNDRILQELAPSAAIDEHGERIALAHGRPVEDGDAVVVATSGTTGVAKGAVHTHQAIEHAAYLSSVALGIGEVKWLACLPLSHVGGFSVITRALLTDADLEVHDGFDAAAVDAAALGGATHVSLVPTALARIRPELWSRILLGGSAIPSRRPANSVATYGMTETFGGVVYDGLALNGVEVRVDAVGEAAGAIELRSPTLLRCYRDGTDPVSADGWYRTGDLGRIDVETGHLQVDGRADDLIITGGEKVWPDVVEAVLRDDPQVHEVAVLGRSDPEWGDRVVAVVVPADAADPPSLDSLRVLVKEHLPVAAAPKELELVDSLPRTALGKIRRSVLRKSRDDV